MHAHRAEMTDYLLPFQPSLAQATNTRLDSACKHIQQCRVSTDDMLRFVREDAEELQRNKYRYCIHKDELVVGVGRPWCVSRSLQLLLHGSVLTPRCQ
jgi:hypothetical protein